MVKHEAIPTQDGLYWYFATGEAEPAPVLVNHARYGNSLKAFNGSLQSWLRKGEYLLGPVAPPAPLSA
ncbi:hypothetical protein [Ottowia sp.]|uniref:hypothetical protein n=1 Tax=Ottowia sp. TaxID=1898956 RepID=UPI0025FEF7EF|nr:hypothetical protein [Ottowia sp.]MBK6616405.1 hypothetical protein [Ottowia sp.]